MRPIVDPVLDFPRRQRLKFSECMPPAFSGDKASYFFRDFLIKYRDYMRIHALTDSQAIDIFLVSLTGLARQWIEPEKYATFHDLEIAFLNRFTPSILVEQF